MRNSCCSQCYHCGSLGCFLKRELIHNSKTKTTDSEAWNMANKLCLDYEICFVELKIQFHISFTISGNGLSVRAMLQVNAPQFEFEWSYFLSPGVTLSTEVVWFKKMKCIMKSTSLTRKKMFGHSEGIWARWIMISKPTFSRNHSSERQYKVSTAGRIEDSCFAFIM